MANSIIAKNYNLSYLFQKVPGYNDEMTNAILKFDRIDKKSSKFDPIFMDVERRQTTAILVDVLASENIVLLHSDKNIASAFSVFAAKDIKTDNKLKVFIDTSVTLQERDGFWMPKNIDKFVAQIVDAMIYLIYYADPDRLVSNPRLLNDATKAFCDLFCYVLDYLRVSGYAENHDRIVYLTAIYFLTSICLKDLNDSTRSIAMKVSGLDTRHANIAEIFLNDPEHQLVNINAFITFLAKSFKLNDLTTEVFVDKWLYVFGPGYQFALEILPAFLRMITDTYSGTYISRQKNIEKVIGKNIVTVTKDIFDIGRSAKRKSNM